MVYRSIVSFHKICDVFMYIQWTISTSITELMRGREINDCIELELSYLSTGDSKIERNTDNSGGQNTCCNTTSLTNNINMYVLGSNLNANDL